MGLVEVVKCLIEIASCYQFSPLWVYGMLLPAVFSSLTPFLSSPCNLQLVQTFLLHEMAVTEQTNLTVVYTVQFFILFLFIFKGQCDWRIFYFLLSPVSPQ